MRNDITVLDSELPEEKAIWLEAWTNSDARDAFAHPEYSALFRDKSTEARCAYYQTVDGTVLFPFLLRRIDDCAESGLRDIATPYGYGGAYISKVSNSDRLMMEFWALFTAWEKQHDIVCETIRCHVLAVCGTYPGEKVKVTENVICELTPLAETQWMQFDHKVRKNVNKARREGVTVEMDEDGRRLADFLKIYYATMSRRNATSSYYYDRKFFERIVEKMKGSYVFANSIHRGEIVSTELVLVSATAIYSFLGGTNEGSYGVCPNDLLKHEVMNWARIKGFRYYVLGGGYVPGDGIFRYKKAFAPEGVRDFFIGSRILAPVAYERLVEGRLERTGRGLAPPPRENYFPLYRG
jgi:hypothetical protein